MKTILLLAALLAAPLHALTIPPPTINISDSRLDVEFYFIDGQGGGAGSYNTALGCWTYSLTIMPGGGSSSTFDGFASYECPTGIEDNLFAGLLPWGSQVFNFGDRYASGDSAWRLVSWAGTLDGDGAFVMHVARSTPTGIPDGGSTIALLLLVLPALLTFRRLRA